MKISLLSLMFIVMVIVLDCNTNNRYEKNQILTDNEWREILINTLFLAEGDKPYVLAFFDNKRSKNILSDIYLQCKNDLGYKINDSILYMIQNRRNNPVTNRLDTILNVSFIYDTTNFKENYVIYSEPFYISNNLICLSMTNKKVKENISLEWIFFFKKQNNTFKLIFFYDVNKDMFYRPASTSNKFHHCDDFGNNLSGALIV